MISPLPNEGVRTTSGFSGGSDSARGEPQLGHQFGDTMPPTRRPMRYPQSRTIDSAVASTAPAGYAKLTGS